MELKKIASQMQNRPVVQQDPMDSDSVVVQTGECKVVIAFVKPSFS